MSMAGNRNQHTDQLAGSLLLRRGWQRAVHRALIIKALTYAPTGGLAAAATTSLPERHRGSRCTAQVGWLRKCDDTL